MDRGIEYQQRQLSLGSSGYSSIDKEAITRFLERKQSEGLSERRLTKLIGHFMRLKPFLDHKDLTTLDADGITRLINTINKHSAWSSWTKHDYLVCIKMFFKFYDDNESRSRIVVIGTPELKQIDEDEVLSLDDLRKLQAASYNIRFKVLVQFLYDSGARVNELLAMNMRDYEFDADGSLWFHLDGTKNKYSKRDIMVDCDESAIELFKEYIAHHPNAGKADAPLWLTFHDERMGDRNLTQRLSELSRKAGISKAVNPHWFRHSKVSEFVTRYGEEASKLYFGWAPDSRMLGVYSHQGKKKLRALMVNKKPLPRERLVDSLSFEVAKLIFGDADLQKMLYAKLEASGKLDLLRKITPETSSGAYTIYGAPWSGKKEYVEAPKKESENQCSNHHDGTTPSNDTPENDSRVHEIALENHLTDIPEPQQAERKHLVRSHRKVNARAVPSEQKRSESHD